MNRLTNNDHTFGPFTFAKSSWKPWRCVWSSGGGDDDEPARNRLTIYLRSWIVRIALPNIIRPHRVRHEANWDEATIKRLGRNHWFETDAREYGFCLSDGHLIFYLGRQTNDSSTTQSWSCFLPWTQWRHVRYSRYGLNGEHWRTEQKGDFLEEFEAMGKCPSASFEFEDYDGERIIAETRIEEREWCFGEKWFKWLSWFRKPKIVRSLDLKFSAEVGPEKGSWKGGTIGHSIEMLPGELHESAFRRYCDMDHERKQRKYKLKFVGPASSPVET